QPTGYRRLAIFLGHERQKRRNQAEAAGPTHCRFPETTQNCSPDAEPSRHEGPTIAITPNPGTHTLLPPCAPPSGCGGLPRESWRRPWPPEKRNPWARRWRASRWARIRWDLRLIFARLRV